MALAPASACGVAADQIPAQALCWQSPPSVLAALCFTGQVQLALLGSFESITQGAP
jgi:hypothetical protein